MENAHVGRWIVLGPLPQGNTFGHVRIARRPPQRRRLHDGAGFDARLDEVKAAISVPEEEVSPFIVFPDDRGAAALTSESPQVQILSRLGFAMAEIPEEVKGDTSMGKDRKDIITLSKESIQKGLPAPVWIAIAADDHARKLIAENPEYNTSPAVKSGQVHYTPGETFRLDYYSAMILLDSLEESFRA